MRGAALTDEQLSREALDGDRGAFVELFGRYEAGLYNVVYRVTGSREDAADITQEAFLRVFGRLDDLAGREVNLGAYLHRTARNLVYDHNARRARERPTATIEREAGADPSLGADPALSALSSEQGADVRAANARLPERHRLVLALRELEGMSYAEIGRVLDITTGAVAQLLARARLALRRELRLEQIDAERMDPACRARLGWIGALMDGELPADRADALAEHISTCPTCTASRAAFQDAQVRYRAWLPLPVIGLGLGATTARAADARFATRAARPPAPPPDLPETLVAAAVPPVRGGRIALLVGALTLVAILVAMSVLVGMRSGSDDSPPPTVTQIAGVPAVVGAPPVANTRTSGATTGTTTTTTGTTTSTGGSAAPSAGAGAPGGGGAATPATTRRSGVGSVAPVRTPTRGGTPTTTAPGAAPPAAVATAPPTTAAGGGEPPASTATEPVTTVPPVTETEPTTTEAPPTTDAPTTPTDTTPAF